MSPWHLKLFSKAKIPIDLDKGPRGIAVGIVFFIYQIVNEGLWEDITRYNTGVSQSMTMVHS